MFENIFTDSIIFVFVLLKYLLFYHFHLEIQILKMFFGKYRTHFEQLLLFDKI